MNRKYLSLIVLIITIIASVFLTGFKESPAFSNQAFGSSASSGHNESSDPLEEENIILVIEVAIGLLLTASLVGTVTERLRVPYTAVLVVIGLVLALIGQREINVSPQLFLGLLVPPLIFEAAFHVKAKGLFQDLAPILSLAIPGVLPLGIFRSRMQLL